MNNPNLPDNCQSLTDKSLPWNVVECDDCGEEVCECEKRMTQPEWYQEKADKHFELFQVAQDAGNAKEADKEMKTYINYNELKEMFDRMN